MKSDMFTKARLELDRKAEFLRWKSEHVNDAKKKRKMNGISLNDFEVVQDMILMKKDVNRRQSEGNFYLDGKKSCIENLKQVTKSLFAITMEKERNGYKERYTNGTIHGNEISRTEKKSRTTIQVFDTKESMILKKGKGDKGYEKDNEKNGAYIRTEKRLNTIACKAPVKI